METNGILPSSDRKYGFANGVVAWKNGLTKRTGVIMKGIFKKIVPKLMEKFNNGFMTKKELSDEWSYD